MPRARRDQLEQALNEAFRIQTLRTVLLNQAIATRAGINPIDLQCLNLLTLHGPLTPSRLAEAMSLTKGGAITAMIDRLEAAGYLHRRRDTQDRRQVLLHIIPGEPLRRLMARFEPVAEAFATMSADYTDDQIQLIIQFITQGNDVIHQLRLDAAPTPHGRDLATAAPRSTHV